MNSCAVQAHPRSVIRFSSGPACLLVILVFVAGVWIGAPTVRSQGEDTYDSEVAKANDLLRRRRYEDALKGYKRANDMRDKKSAECLLGMAQAYFGLEAYKNVVETCEKVIEVAPGDVQSLAQAYNFQGIALQTQAAVKDQKNWLMLRLYFAKVSPSALNCQYFVTTLVSLCSSWVATQRE
ncbi:MAG TPA: tetratricopeptide repeat protein [Pyrinomonadaceae bacterium]